MAKREPDNDDEFDDDEFDDDEDEPEGLYATYDEWLDAYFDGLFDDDSIIEFDGGLDTGGAE